MKWLFGAVFSSFFGMNAIAGVLECTSSCTHFDRFSDSCLYATTCEVERGLMIYKYCERWDNFNNTCGNEEAKYTRFIPDRVPPSTSCTETCQYYDRFNERCLYRTACEFHSSCISHTRCDEWDQFDERCLTEIKQTSCATVE